MKLAEAREAQGLTGKALANLLGVPHPLLVRQYLIW
jgi:transcriptional regulator with XRE-family HTH domain